VKKKHSPKITQANFKDLRQKVIQRQNNNFSGAKMAAILLIAVSTVYNWLKLLKKSNLALEPHNHLMKTELQKLPQQHDQE
jgi:predicted AAA+ superfamily ATPase